MRGVLQVDYQDRAQFERTGQPLYWSSRDPNDLVLFRGLVLCGAVVKAKGCIAMWATATYDWRSCPKYWYTL